MHGHPATLSLLINGLLTNYIYHFICAVSGAETAASAGGLPPSGAAPVRPYGGRFRGVTKHKRTQRYEAHIWQCKKQLYLGGFDSEILAAKSHGEPLISFVF